MIDVTQPPYNCRADWNGSDSAATDNYAPIQQALYDAGKILFPDTDRIGAGDLVLLPKGAMMISQKLVVPHGVTVQGAGDYASILRMKESFDPNSHFIDLGDATLKQSVFGCRLRNMILFSPPDLEGAMCTAMVYTNNAQDTEGMLDGVRIYGFQRRCFWGEIGYGGATSISLKQVTGNTLAPGTPAFTFNYSDACMIDVEGIEPSGGRQSNDPTSSLYNLPIANTIGIILQGGYARFRRVHFEECDQCFFVNMDDGQPAGSGQSFCDIDFMTGNTTNNHLIVYHNNSAQKGRMRLTNVKRNGITGHTVWSGVDGVPNIDTDIVDTIRI